jgi:hypothetical protein
VMYPSSDMEMSAITLPMLTPPGSAVRVDATNARTHRRAINRVGALNHQTAGRTGVAVAYFFEDSSYDADQTVMAFGARLKDAINLDAVADDLAQVASGALEPAHVSMWTRPAERQ